MNHACWQQIFCETMKYASSIKKKHGASIINPLEKYQLRSDKKVYTALFDGMLDAIPVFNEHKLKSIINQ